MILRNLSILIPAFLASPAIAQEQQQPDDQTIVVTGTPLSETERQLQACLARDCPPREDIDASLAHAENQFIAGDYHDARSTLAASRSRNARYAKQYPVEVADLTRAYGRMTDLDGHRELSRVLQIESLDALKSGLDKGDSRVLMQRLMVGDEYARSGRIDAAVDVYRGVARQARKQGLQHVAGHSMFREAVLYGAVSEFRPEYRSATAHAIRRLEQTTEPELAPFRSAARMYRASLASKRGDKQAFDQAVAGLEGQRVDKPVLLYSPTIRIDQPPATDVPVTKGLHTGPEWIDVRFRVAADGTVHDIETLQQSGTVHGVWPEKVRQALAGRRYAPLRLEPGSGGFERVERFTMVFDTLTPTGSRLRSRSLRGRLTSLDLTLDKAKPSPGNPGKGQP